MKHVVIKVHQKPMHPAAFGRLCVETMRGAISRSISNPAAFGRLCVETIFHAGEIFDDQQPAAFGRLCVETDCTGDYSCDLNPSRLRAAVC